MNSLRPKHPKQLLHRIKIPIHHPLLQRNDRIIRDRNMLRTNLCAALSPNNLALSGDLSLQKDFWQL